MRRMYSLNQLEEIVKERVESGQLDNAKPIYCHPITIDGETATYKIHVSLLIFDNSNEEYNTYAKLLAKINAILSLNENAVFPITGGIYYGSSSSLQIAQKIAKYSNYVALLSMRPDGTQGFFGMSNFESDSYTYYDGVNKIN